MNENHTGLELQETAPPEALLPDHGPWPWWLAAGVAVAVILVALWLVRKRKSPAADPRKIRENAYNEALAAIAEIHSRDAREAAVRCSLVVRKYLSVSAADPALYETHEEFIARQDALKALTGAARAAADAGFSRLAALKYGPQAPGTPAADVIAESRGLLETLHHGFAA